MANYYDEVVKLCGFEDEEIKKESPRIEKAFQRLDLGPKDMETAQSWIKQNHDVQLMGVRRVLGLWLKELIDLVLAKDEGKKVVYYGYPTISGPGATIAAAADNIYCSCPDTVLCSTIGQIFNKLTPILEAGEENGLPPGHGLCSLQQIRVGALAKGIIPVPDMVLTSGYYCDMGSKTDELLHQRYGHPAIYIDGSMDSRWGEFPGYLPKRIDFLGGELEKAFDSAQDILGVEITEETRREAASRDLQLAGALGKLFESVNEGDPQPVSIVDIGMARRLFSGSVSKRIALDGPKVISILNQEIRERIDKGIGVVEKGAPRVGIYLGHFSDPSIQHMMENSGLSFKGTLFSHIDTGARKAASIISGKILAEVEMGRGIYHSAYGATKRLEEGAQLANIDGLIWNYLFNCRPVAIRSVLFKKFVEKETGIPVLALESDIYDSRFYNAEALRTRVETFAEMLRERKVFAKA